MSSGGYTTTTTTIATDLGTKSNANSTTISNIAAGSILGLMYLWWILIVVLIWLIAGITGFWASIVCLFYNSSFGDKIAGLIMGLFSGPFYWLFYIYNMNYCNRYSYN